MAGKRLSICRCSRRVRNGWDLRINRNEGKVLDCAEMADFLKDIEKTKKEIDLREVLYRARTPVNLLSGQMRPHMEREYMRLLNRLRISSLSHRRLKNESR